MEQTCYFKLLCRRVISDRSSPTGTLAVFALRGSLSIKACWGWNRLGHVRFKTLDYMQTACLSSHSYLPSGSFPIFFL